MARRSRPHTRLDNRLFDLAPEIGSIGFMLYAFLTKYENRSSKLCCPSLQTLARVTDTDKKTVIKYLDLLIEHGLIDKQHRFTARGQTSNQYNLKPIGQALRPGGSLGSPLPVEQLDYPSGTLGSPQHLGGEQIDINKGKPSERQEKCSHPEVVNLPGGIVLCNVCFWLVMEEIETAAMSATDAPDCHHTPKTDPAPLSVALEPSE